MRRCFSAVTLLALAFSLGCGPGDGMADVSGKVTFKGEPLAKGAIAFFPLSGDAPTTGGNIENGAYSVRVPPGEMKVTISAVKIVGQKPAYENAPNSPIMNITEEALPRKYNAQSELKFDVKPGSNKKDWNLVE